MANWVDHYGFIKFSSNTPVFIKHNMEIGERNLLS